LLKQKNEDISNLNNKKNKAANCAGELQKDKFLSIYDSSGFNENRGYSKSN
jgi:hypothetical protein